MNGGFGCVVFSKAHLIKIHTNWYDLYDMIALGGIVLEQRMGYEWSLNLLHAVQMYYYHTYIWYTSLFLEKRLINGDRSIRFMHMHILCPKPSQPSIHCIIFSFVFAQSIEMQASMNLSDLFLSFAFVFVAHIGP